MKSVNLFEALERLESLGSDRCYSNKSDKLVVQYLLRIPISNFARHFRLSVLILFNIGVSCSGLCGVSNLLPSGIAG
jgi:hypothetical protein